MAAVQPAERQVPGRADARSERAESQVERVAAARLVAQQRAGVLAVRHRDGLRVGLPAGGQDHPDGNRGAPRAAERAVVTARLQAAV